MKILDRYIAGTVIQGSLMTVFVLAAIAVFFGFVSELDDLTRDYGALKALAYVLLTLPSRAYELFPTAVLVGSLLGLGNLAAGSELVVMRAAGLSVKRIAWSVMQAGLVLAVIAALLGELVAPKSERFAQDLRTSARSGYITLTSDYGFWARDGMSFVNIRQVLPGARLEGIYIYDYDAQQRLQSTTYAESAEYERGRWQLHNIERSVIEGETAGVQTQATAEWESLLDPELLDVLALDPEDLSAWSLLRYIVYLKKNSLDATRYELALWIKLMTPLSTLVMLLIAIPFVFGPLRSTGSGPRLLVGVLIGIAFYLMNQGFNHVGLLYGLNPLLSAALPSILFAIAGLIGARKVS